MMDAKDFVMCEGIDIAVHMVGNYVAVCCNAQRKRQTVIHDGHEYDTYIRVPNFADPYINFVDLRQDRGGEWYMDEDSPADGGFSPELAEQFAAELLAAVAYIREV